MTREVPGTPAGPSDPAADPFEPVVLADAAGAARRLAALRRDYVRGTLDEQQVDADPLVQFRRWFDDAVAFGLPEPNAMVVATASADGDPSARTVLLKALDDRGFVFFSQSVSRKGHDLAGNPRASLVFPWFEMDRQIVVRGAVEQVSRAETEAYFAARPRGARLGAWVSEQSSVLPDRQTLDRAYADAMRRWGELDVPVPQRWVGYRVLPRAVELWQGRPSRLHDRLRYRAEGGRWLLERLSP